MRNTQSPHLIADGNHWVYDKGRMSRLWGKGILIIQEMVEQLANHFENYITLAKYQVKTREIQIK